MILLIYTEIKNDRIHLLQKNFFITLSKVRKLATLIKQLYVRPYFIKLPPACLMMYYIVFVLFFVWCLCVAIHVVSVQYNNGVFLPDIILLTQCYYNNNIGEPV